MLRSELSENDGPADAVALLGYSAQGSNNPLFAVLGDEKSSAGMASKALSTQLSIVRLSSRLIGDV